MDELNALLKPSWGSEQWILEGWNCITTEEKTLIKGRLDALFKDGLPLKLKHDKLFYIYTFSLLAQLEVLAIQVPLKFESRMTSKAHRKSMHIQLLDEIFHGLVFTKIVYQLASPHALPPKYCENIERLCDFIRQEECPKIAVVLLNLIAEGWIEEIFATLEQHEIAPKVFETILKDEHRHVSEADLYREIGLPDSAIVRSKIDYLEKHLLTNILLQYKYMASMGTLLGVEGAIGFIRTLNKKHSEQLQKIALKPSQNWQFLMKIAEKVFPKILLYAQSIKEIELTPLRQIFLTQWGNPLDPTMIGDFNVNVSCIDFFNKKYPPETLTTLVLQTISLCLYENSPLRYFLSNSKMYQTKESYIGLAVKLPDCNDHIGTIVYENCHNLTAQALSSKVRNTLMMMVYCYKKREQLEKSFPHLAAIMQDTLYEHVNEFYGSPLFGSSVATLSNIGSCGYSQGKSPLRPNESVKFTLFEVEKKLVWNKETQAFEPQDILPVSMSADHRVFDGNIPMPKLFVQYFERIFAKLTKDLTEPQTPSPVVQSQAFIKMFEQLLTNNLELGYKSLLMLQTYWPDFLSLDELLNIMNWIKKEAPSQLLTGASST